MNERLKVATHNYDKQALAA